MRISDWSSDVCSSDLKNADNDRGHRIGPDQKRRVDPAGPHHPVDADGQEERKPHRQRGHRNGENRRLFKRIDIARILKDAAVILKPDEGRLEPERVLPLERRFDRLKGRPDEKHQSDDKLWRQQQIGQQLVRENRAFGLHGSSTRTWQLTPVWRAPAKEKRTDVNDRTRYMGFTSLSLTTRRGSV